MNNKSNLSSSDHNDLNNDRFPQSGTKTIQRNRRGPMYRSRIHSNMSTISISSSVSRNNSSTHYRRKHEDYSSSDSISMDMSMSTHLDHDDREILIESALGRSRHHDYDSNDYSSRGTRNSSSLLGQKLSKLHAASSSSSSNKKHHNQNFMVKNNYAPIQGYDVFSEEERNYFTQYPKAESIFEIPPFICIKDCFNINNNRKKKRFWYRFMVIKFGISLCVIIMVVLNKRYHHLTDSSELQSSNNSMVSLDKLPVYVHVPSKPVETSIDIKHLTTKNVFTNSSESQNNNNDNDKSIRDKQIEQDSTMDMGYNNGEDDMVVSNTAVANKSSNTGQDKANPKNNDGVAIEEIHDDFVSTEGGQHKHHDNSKAIKNASTNSTTTVAANNASNSEKEDHNNQEIISENKGVPIEEIHDDYVVKNEEQDKKINDSIKNSEPQQQLGEQKQQTVNIESSMTTNANNNETSNQQQQQQHQHQQQSAEYQSGSSTTDNKPSSDEMNQDSNNTGSIESNEMKQNVVQSKTDATENETNESNS